MEIIRGLHNLRSRHRGVAVTIGNFDGVHLGHRAVLDQLMEVGSRLRVATTLITFEPHPGEFFSGPDAPSRLTRFREKMRALAETPLDRVLVLRFEASLSRVPAALFIERYLLEGLGVKHLLVGDDFRFGYRAEGNFQMLRGAADRQGFELSRLDTLRMDGRRVSSGWVREALENGDLGLVSRLIGRPYTILGRVAHGRRLGHTIGFPTANLHVRRKSWPVRGVFAVRVAGVGGAPMEGMANVGTRPTVDGTRWVLEVHLFDFQGELYGRELRVDFVDKLRDERRFESVDALKAQLAQDAEGARAALRAAA